MARKQNVSADADYFTGEDKTLTVTVYQANGTTPQDITGWTLSWMIKRKRTDADASAVLTKTTPTDIVLTTPLSGVCTITVTDENIAALSAESQYVHELKRTNAGAETVLMYGTFTLRQAVHR